MKNEDFYDRIRKRLKAWAKSKEGKQSKWLEYILILPDFFYLLCALALDPAVPGRHKAKLALVIAYIVSPLDLIPEGLIGPAGYADDVALAAYALNRLLKDVDQEIVLKHWKGEADLLKMIQRIIEVADQMVGSGLWSRLKGTFGTRTRRPR